MNILANQVNECMSRVGVSITSWALMFPVISTSLGNVWC